MSGGDHDREQSNALPPGSLGGAMRRVLTVLAGVALMFGVAVPAASATTAPVTQVIKVKAVQSPHPFLCSVFSSTETLWQNGKKVGHDAVTCTFPNPSPTAVGH